MATSKKTILTGLIVLLLVGCKNSDTEFSTYLSVGIPSYTRLEYNQLLSSKDDDQIYNAITNLIDDAEYLGETLAKDCSDKKTEGCDENYKNTFKVASEIYAKISSQLDSENVKIVSAAVRFLNFLGSKFTNKDEFIQRLLKVESLNDNVQLEVVNALSKLVTPKTNLSYSQIEKYLHNESWLVSRKAYSLVNALENDQARRELMNDYASLTDEAEKLLRLEALSNNYTKETFEIYTNEILNNQNQKIKSYIFSVLGNTKDSSHTLSWFELNYSKFKPDEIKEIASNYYGSMDSEFGSSLFVILINNGFDPKIEPKSDDDSTPMLFHVLSKAQQVENTKELSEEEIQSLERLKKIDLTLTNSKFSFEWLAHKTADEIKIPAKEFIEEFDKNLENYFQQTKSTFEKHHVEGVDDYLKHIKNAIDKYNNGAFINIKN